VNHEIHLATVPRRLESIVSELTGDEAVLLLPERREIKVLNEVGARTWDLIDGNRTVTDIVAVICGQYEATREQVESDTIAFLNELLALGVIACEPAPDEGVNAP